MNKLDEYKLLREYNIRLARNNFYHFCCLREPEFYKNKTHLKTICDTLQKLYEGNLINKQTNKPYRKLMLNIPPRHGKSRTLVNFTAWALGKSINNMIMTISYNEDSATEFSRFTRDIIQDDPAAGPITYQDIFPTVKIKHGNSAANKWALEGHFFNYLGSSFNGSVTGKGSNLMIIDDPVKNAYEALNENILNQIYEKYNNTLLSRLEGNAIQIICMTRWSSNDLCGKLLAKQDDWYVLKMPACENNKMLCSQILSLEKYNELKNNMDPLIFYANYQQEEINAKDALYTKFKEYKNIPNFEKIVSYTDTADKGTDYLCTWIAGLFQKELYILDLVYTQEPMEKTLPLVTNSLYINKTNIAIFESNNGGRLFAINVKEKLKEIYNSNYTVVKDIPQTKNKETRILMNAYWIQEHVYFPYGFKNKYPLAYKNLISYSRTGKNLHDDIQDALTGLVEYFGTNKPSKPNIRIL